MPEILPLKIFGIVVVVAWSYTASGEEKKGRQYEAELSRIQEKTMSLREQIANEQSQIGNLKRLISETDQKIASSVQNRNSRLGVTGQDIKNADIEVSSLRQGLDSLLSNSPEDLVRNKDKISEFESRISSLKSRSIAQLNELKPQITIVDSLFSLIVIKLQDGEAIHLKNQIAAQQSDKDNATAGNELPEQEKQPDLLQNQAENKEQLVERVSSYTVLNLSGKSESLSKIAARPDIYGDPNKWYLIYKANKKLIDGNYEKLKSKSVDSRYIQPQDLIFPGQVLLIPQQGK